MRPKPTEKLDPRAKNVWRINDGLLIVCLTAGALAAEMLFGAMIEDPAFASTLLMPTAVLGAVCLAVWLVAIPPIRYARWRYQVTPEFLDIEKGIIWRQRIIVPFIRVQNTDTRQGPILRAFHLASVTVSTAAQEHEIPCLSEQVAEQLRDKAAEFARLAREDV
ncbi:MAG: PH domain-containing protein [Eggerthellaceae bacterium]|jgi:membrane protein YdbS with pleckstrin-like domain